MELSEPTRRRAIWALGAAGMAALTAGDIAPHRADHRPPAPVPRPRPAPRPARPRPVPGWTQERLRALHKPVRTLRDLAPAAPSDAVALTIDDGPHPTWTPKVLDLLAEHQVKASFCLIGEQVAEQATLVKRIVRAGHQVVNHTMTHRMPFDRLPTKTIKAEITEAHKRISDTGGLAPRFFRAPGGAFSERVLEVAGEQGLLPILWDVDPRDWARPGTGRIKHALLGARPGAILLCHDGGGDRAQTMSALRTTIPKLKKRGLKFVAL